MEASEIVRATVERRHSNSRLDGFLTSVLKGVDGFSLFSREKVKKGVLSGLVSVNGETEPDPGESSVSAKSSSRIFPEERVLEATGIEPRVLFGTNTSSSLTSRPA